MQPLSDARSKSFVILTSAVSVLLSTEGSATFIILHYCQQRALLHSLFCTIVNRGLCYIHYFALLSTEGSVTFIILHYCQQRALLHSLFCTIVNRGLCYIHYFALLSTAGSVTFIILHYCQQRALLHSLFCIFLKTIAISSDLFSNCGT